MLKRQNLGKKFSAGALKIRIIVHKRYMHRMAVQEITQNYQSVMIQKRTILKFAWVMDSSKGGKGRHARVWNHKYPDVQIACTKDKNYPQVDKLAEKTFFGSDNAQYGRITKKHHEDEKTFIPFILEERKKAKPAINGPLGKNINKRLKKAQEKVNKAKKSGKKITEDDLN